MPKVCIVGNSGAARECYWILRDLLESSPGLAAYYAFSGFYSWDAYPDNLKELAEFSRGPIETHRIDGEELYIIGIGKPDLRRGVFMWLKERKAKLMNLIHPWTAICPSATMGEGNVFQRGCTVYANAQIGNGNYINGAANLSHDAKIGDFNFLAPYAIVLGGAHIGDLNWLAPHAVIMDRAGIGDHNLVAPNSSVFKGAGSNARLIGSPAIKMGEHHA